MFLWQQSYVGPAVRVWTCNIYMKKPFFSGQSFQYLCSAPPPRGCLNNMYNLISWLITYLQHDEAFVWMHLSGKWYGISAGWTSLRSEGSDPGSQHGDKAINDWQPFSGCFVASWIFCGKWRIPHSYLSVSSCSCLSFLLNAPYALLKFIIVVQELYLRY